MAPKVATAVTVNVSGYEKDERKNETQSKLNDERKAEGNRGWKAYLKNQKVKIAVGW